MTQFENLYQSIETIEEVSMLEAFLDRLRKSLNFEFILYVMQFPTTFTQAKMLYFGNYPLLWKEEYSKNLYVRIDPVVKHCHSSLLPYCWEKLYQTNKSPEVVHFMSRANTYGLCGGLSIGIKSFGGTAGLISLAGRERLEDSSDRYLEAVTVINSISPLLHEKIIELANGFSLCEKVPYLSNREKECLTWVAEGKTSAEIAIILSIVERTVIYHLKNVIKKMSVSNRNQAIAKAVQIGLIQPEFHKTPTF